MTDVTITEISSPTSIVYSSETVSIVSKPSEFSPSGFSYAPLSGSDVTISDPTYTLVSEPSVP